ncbi:MAG: DUF2760 domain-containing protein [Cellvibrionales bacterium]|nr:DUF2760 domain-containing protein [Cellvibrionales bacterium]
MSESLVTFPTQLDALHLLLATVALICIAFCLLAKSRKTTKHPDSEAAHTQIPKEVAATEKPETIECSANQQQAFINQGGLQLLSVLQQEGRFIDFLQEEVTHFSDEEVGAAARVIHQGCKKALNQMASLSPVCDQEEASPIALSADYDKNAYLLTGQVTGEPPFNGTLIHAGWKADRFEMPTLTHSNPNAIIAKAEVEL